MAGWPSLIIEADVDAANVDAPLGQLPGNHSFFDIEPNDPLWLVVTLTSALVLLALTLCVYLSARQGSRGSMARSLAARGVGSRRGGLPRRQRRLPRVARDVPRRQQLPRRARSAGDAATILLQLWLMIPACALAGAEPAARRSRRRRRAAVNASAYNSATTSCSTTCPTSRGASPSPGAPRL